jgi:hypothetical protein
MPQFYYHTHVKMPPRPGRRYSTDYYRQTRSERQRLQNWIQQRHDEIVAVAIVDPDMATWLDQPLRSCPREQRGRYYSMYEIVTDALNQLESGKDITQGMLNRWNRLCAGTPWEIDLEESTLVTVPPAALPPTQFQALFST